MATTHTAASMLRLRPFSRSFSPTAPSVPTASIVRHMPKKYTTKQIISAPAAKSSPNRTQDTRNCQSPPKNTEGMQKNSAAISPVPAVCHAFFVAQNGNVTRIARKRPLAGAFPAKKNFSGGAKRPQHIARLTAYAPLFSAHGCNKFVMREKSYFNVLQSGRVCVIIFTQDCVRQSLSYGTEGAAARLKHILNLRWYL